jgi:hypothetical protein
MARSIRGVVVLALFAAGLSSGHADARVRRAKTEVVNVQATVRDGHITAVSGQVVSRTKCVPGRAISVLWGADSAEQLPYGTGATADDGTFTVTGAAPQGSFITVQAEEVKRGRTICKRGGFFGVLP